MKNNLLIEEVIKEMSRIWKVIKYMSKYIKNENLRKLNMGQSTVMSS